MKILFTGGGSGGHFYPIIAIADAIKDIQKEEKLLGVQMFYMAPDPYDKGLLFEKEIKFIPNTAGKVRRYFSILNFFDFFKTIWGTLTAIWRVFTIYPDVVVGKGGYGSFPALFAARILKIPVIIHESDTVPGRVNKWAGKFAEKIALSYPEAAKYFPKKKQNVIAHTGNPIRKELMKPLSEGAAEFLKLEENIPTIFVLGGSQGARVINSSVLDALPKLLEKYQVIHQVGDKNLEEVKETIDVILRDNPKRGRYKPFAYLNVLAMRMSAGAADIIISRAGSSIFEIANWGVPSLIVPIESSNGDHQRKNAFAYAKVGAAMVIEEENLTPNIIVSEIDRLIENPSERRKMSEAAKNFAKQGAAEKIANQVLSIAIKHEV